MPDRLNITPSAARTDELLKELVWRVRRLCPDHRDPHRFHEEKSEIAHDLNRLAKRIKT